MLYLYNGADKQHKGALRYGANRGGLGFITALPNQGAHKVRGTEHHRCCRCTRPRYVALPYAPRVQLARVGVCAPVWMRLRGCASVVCCVQPADTKL